MDEKKEEVKAATMDYYILVRFGGAQKIFTLPYELNYVSVGDEVTDCDGRIGRVVGCCSDLSTGETAVLMRAMNWGDPIPLLKSKIIQNDFSPREEKDDG